MTPFSTESDTEETNHFSLPVRERKKLPCLPARGEWTESQTGPGLGNYFPSTFSSTRKGM